MRIIFAALLAACLSLVGACSSTPDLPPLAPGTSGLATEVRIQPGDELELKFAYTPELDTTHIVRADGRISAPLVGAIDVAGTTPDELEQALLDAYSTHLKSPAISVIMRTALGRRVYVGGYVTTPGVVDMPGELTVLEAILQSGGFDKLRAEPSSVVVIRRSGTQHAAYLVDLRAAWRNERTERFLLSPGDIVHVPQTRIAELDQWVDQHINRLIPQIGLRYGTTVAGGTVSVGATN